MIQNTIISNLKELEKQHLGLSNDQRIKPKTEKKSFDGNKIIKRKKEKKKEEEEIPDENFSIFQDASFSLFARTIRLGKREETQYRRNLRKFLNQRLREQRTFLQFKFFAGNNTKSLTYST